MEFAQIKQVSIDLRSEVLREAVSAAARQTMPSMRADGKEYTPTEAALAVVEAYQAAVKAIAAEAGQASGSAL